MGLSTVPALGLFGYAWREQRQYQQAKVEAAPRGAGRRRRPAGDQRGSARRGRSGPGADRRDAAHSRPALPRRVRHLDRVQPEARGQPVEGSSTRPTATRTTARCSTRRRSSTRSSSPPPTPGTRSTRSIASRPASTCTARRRCPTPSRARGAWCRPPARPASSCQIGHQRRSNPRYLHCYEKLLGEAKLLGRIVTINGQWNRARGARPRGPGPLRDPGGAAEAVRLQGHAPVPQLALVQGPGRRADRGPRLAPDRHLHLVPRREPVTRDGERRAALPRPEDARVVRHGHGRLRLRHAAGPGEGVLPDADDQRQPGLLRELHGRPGDAAHLRVGGELRGASSTATRTPPPGTRGSRRDTSPRPRSRR